MANITKLILPLAADCIDLSDLSENAGFVDAFVYDINRPTLNNHLFLLYKVNTGKWLITNSKLRKSNNLYSVKTIRIDGVDYVIYTLCTIGKVFNCIREGRHPSTEDEYLKIFKFWMFTDEYINKLLTFRYAPYETEGIELTVPEEDYDDEFEDCLEIEKAPSIQ